MIPPCMLPVKMLNATTMRPSGLAGDLVVRGNQVGRSFRRSRSSEARRSLPVDRACRVGDRHHHAASRSRIHAEPRLTITLSDCSHGRSIIRPLIANSTSTGRPRHPGNVSRGTALSLPTRSPSRSSATRSHRHGADPHADLGMTADVGGSGTLGAGGVLPPLTGDSALVVGVRGAERRREAQGKLGKLHSEPLVAGAGRFPE
jgi:hypothetical protein